MNNLEFVEKLLYVHKNYNTCYAKGTFGQKATDSFINQKKNQYPTWYTSGKVNALKALDDNTRLFDCVGLIKGVLWGFPNMVYTSNNVPDVSDYGIYNVCKDKSSDFNNIEIGELVSTTGHVGVYIGDGLCIECTNAWEGKVIITSLSDRKGYHTRKWLHHGKLPYIEYVNNSFKVKVETEWLEAHLTYNPVKIYKDKPVIEIVSTKDNFGKTKEGYWIDLTKCRRV